MKGTACYYSPKLQRVAVLTEYGYTVFDIEHGSVSIGDAISGDLNIHGGVTLFNETKKEQLAVFVEAIQATKQYALNLLSQI